MAVPKRKPTLSIVNDGIVSGIEAESVEKNVQTRPDENAEIRGFIDGVSGKTAGEVVDGRNNGTVGDDRQLNSVSGEAGLKDSAFSLPETSGESAGSRVDGVFYNNLTAGLRGEKTVDADGEAEAPIGELSENVDENIDKNSENFEKDLENGQNGEYNKNKGSVDDTPQYETLKSVNMRYEGMRNPLSGVLYERRIVSYKDKQYHMVVPKFDIVGQVKLSRDFLFLGNRVQFREATRLLNEQIKQNPKLGEAFTESQLKEIQQGKVPTGYTWHHDTDEGVMSLVDKEIHRLTKHTGGKFLWDGGYKRNRRKQ